ncbi:MAG: D-2-hydroxyacid dehydrogenase [Lachnospiraceae bacterium]
MKLVFLDAKSIGEDIDLSGFDKLGEVEKYDFTRDYEVEARSRDADILIVNKVSINSETIAGAKNLKMVCVTATGTNNLDKAYLEERGILWRNVAGYSTESVAQHTFAMFFYLYEKLRYYDEYVKSGAYVNDTIFTHFSEHFHELNQKTWGIIGMGSIGQRVATIAQAFGCRVIYYSTSGLNHQSDFQEVSFQTLLGESDVISVHAPLNENTQDLMDRAAFLQMKPEAVFLNLGRGQIVVEEDLAAALEEGEIAAAGLDVLTKEPMSEHNPLLRIKDSNRLLITPHIAWASVEARNRLMRTILDQVRDEM